MSDGQETNKDNRRKGDMKEDIFGKYDVSEMAESDMETDDDNSDEDESHKRKHDRKKKHRPNPWDRLIERAYDSVQEQFNETVETALEEDSRIQIWK